VFFEVGSSALDANTHAVIRAVARIMLAQPGRVPLSGHTDDSGPDELNEQLATARADAVKALLVEAGIDPGRLSTRGAGRREPISTTAQRFGRSINRTVTFDWVE
jgi:OOP family OmpA-OmpF porin